MVDMMLESSPQVTIVTPVYNGARYLRELINSVQRQTYPNIEHIVIDDGSTDDGATVNILSEYSQLRWWTRANRGQYATLNEGFSAARGEIVTTISADDYYVDSDVIADVVAAFLASPAHDIVFGRTLHVNSERAPIPVQPFQNFPLWVLPYNLFISHCSLFVRTERLRENRLLFDPSYRYLGDADWITRLFNAGMAHVKLGRTIAAYRHHPVQASRQPKEIETASIRDAAERAKFKRQYANRASLQQAVDSFVSWRHRVLMSSAMARNGGISGLARAVREWRTRQVVS